MSSSPDTLGKASKTSPDTSSTAKKREKRKYDRVTYYDLHDPFIDDSELIEMITNQHEQVSTVHEGFFVNSGDLKLKGKRKPDESPKSNEEKGANASAM